MKKIGGFFKAIDHISESPSTRIHFGDDDTKHKTITGGICTCLGILVFLIVCGQQGIRILSMKTPNVQSQEVPFEYSKKDSNEPWKMDPNEAYLTIYVFDKQSKTKPRDPESVYFNFGHSKIL